MAEIGSTLREARMRAHIDISEVEAKTKIRAKYLRAIENEEWDLLPGPIYVKSFLKTYGDCLGLDSRLLIDEFKRRYERPDQDAPAIATLHRERERAARGPLVPSWLLTSVVLVAIVGALYVVGKGVGGGSPSKQSSSQVANDRRPRRHQKHHATTTPTITIPAIPAKATLRLVPTAAVWVCVVNGTGHALIPGTTYDVGETIPAVHAPRLMVTLGNNSVTMRADGKPFTIAASSGPIQFEVTPTGVRTLAAGRGPTC